MDFCWTTAEQSIVRQLGWSLFSPSILEITLPATQAAWKPAEDEETRHLLRSLDQNPAPLKQALASRKDRRLGAYFESLWEYFFDSHSFYRVLAKNRQIFDGKTTLGALDFIIEDQTRNQIVHLELAVKFYLYFPDALGTGLEKWIGPNPDDNLAIKYRHLIDHQLPLSSEKTTVSTLKAAEIAQPQLKVAVVKGYLFCPVEQVVKPGLPVNNYFQQGIWVKLRKLETLATHFPDWKWCVLDKKDWLDPRPLPRGYQFHSLEVIGQQCYQPEQPQLLIGRKEGGLSGNQGETPRCFVIPDGWPGEMKPAALDGDPEGT